jgi:hypothetical protein
MSVPLSIFRYMKKNMFMERRAQLLFCRKDTAQRRKIASSLK